MRKIVQKMICPALALLLLLSAFPALAADSFVFEAKVAASEEITAALPFEGKAAEMYVQAGQRVKKGDKLLTMAASSLVAKEESTVEAVFAEVGMDGKFVEETYHAAVFLRPIRPMYVYAAVKGAVQTKENTTYTRGETIYIKGTKTKHVGVGRIINIKTWTYTVEILEGDLEEGDAVKLYRDPEYSEKSRVGNGTVKYFDLTAMNLDGFIISVNVKNGDTVQPGDVLLTYAPSLKLDVYADEDSVILKTDKSTATVTMAHEDDLHLTASLSALEVSLLEARSAITITQDGNPDFAAEGTVEFISSIADENGNYEVRLACPIDTPRIGAIYVVKAE